MPLERKAGGATSANNNGFPSTAYGGDLDQYTTGSKGVLVACDANGKKVVEYWVDLSDASKTPSASESDTQIHTIPALAVIKECETTVQSTVSGGTDFSVGLSQPDGTVIDADGLMAAVADTAVGAHELGAGALIGASVGANSAQVTVTGTRTAGQVKVKLTYVEYNS